MQSERADPQQRCTGHNARAHRRDRDQAKSAAKAKPAAANEAPVWPDGYVVASAEEWIPVINQAGKKLEAARKDFVRGSHEKAATDLHAAAAAIREDAKAAQTDLRGKLEHSAKDLEAIAEKLTHGGGVERGAIEAALVNAYRQDAPVTWLYSQDEIVRPYFERPSEHSARALELLAQHDYAGAAAEIRRSTAYFRLAALSARDDDRELLQGAVNLLNARAKQADAGKLTPEALRQTLARVDAAYAESYLHQAEARYEAKDAGHTARPLSEAVARMRSRLRWMGQETETASMAIVDQVETLAGKLGKGAKVAAKDASSVFKRAHDQVKRDSDSQSAVPHG